MKKLRFFSHKKFILSLLSVVICLSIALSAIADTPKHYTELEFPPLEQVQIPKYDRYELPNGMVVYLMPDRDLPLVGGTAIVRTGDRLRVRRSNVRRDRSAECGTPRPDARAAANPSDVPRPPPRRAARSASA